MKKNELSEIIEEILATGDCAWYGVRTQEMPFVLGPISHTSSVWVEGEKTEEELGGISCTNAESDMIIAHCDEEKNRRFFYYGDHIAIIGGDLDSFGEDAGEVILKNAKVVRIIK